jgi:hypothetical protein
MTENTIENSERGDKARDLLSAIDDYASRHFSTGVMHARGQEGGASTWADQRRALAAMLDELQREAYAEGRKDEAEESPATARDAARYRQLRKSAQFAFRHYPMLQWHLPRSFFDQRTAGERLDASIDAEIERPDRSSDGPK